MTDYVTDEMVEKVARAMDSNFDPDRHPFRASVFRGYAKARAGGPQ